MSLRQAVAVTRSDVRTAPVVASTDALFAAAAGDGLADIAGRKWGKAALPHNKTKVRTHTIVSRVRATSCPEKLAEQLA